MAEMLEGVTILLERMKTNPEEFYDSFGKWGWLVDILQRKNADKYPLTDEEFNALRSALIVIDRERLNKRVIESLMNAKQEPEQLGLPYTSSNSITFSTGWRERMRLDSDGNLGIGVG